jgi:hypothetical protein
MNLALEVVQKNEKNDASEEGLDTNTNSDSMKA